MIDISETILAKSDQLNAVDLAGDVTVKIVNVEKTATDQPVSIHLEGYEGRPYKPCLSMRRVLGICWGTDASQWIGRSMTLYCDMRVTWGGKAIGGIRISHLSDIKREIEAPIQVAKNKREVYTVKPLHVADKKDWKKIIDSCEDNAAVDNVIKGMKSELTKSEFMSYKDTVVKKRESFDKTHEDEK